LGSSGERVIECGALHPKDVAGPRFGHPISERLANGLQQCVTDGWGPSRMAPKRPRPRLALPDPGRMGWRDVALRMTRRAEDVRTVFMGKLCTVGLYYNDKEQKAPVILGETPCH